MWTPRAARSSRPEARSWFPAAVDPHTHFDLPVGAVRSADDFESGTIAAACGGTTTVIDFAGAGREPAEEALRTWHEKADGRAAIDYGFHLTVTDVPEDHGEALRALPLVRRRGRDEREALPRVPRATHGRRGDAAPGTHRPRARPACSCASTRRTASRPCAARGGCSRAGETGPAGLIEARPPAIEAAADAHRGRARATRSTRRSTSSTCRAPRASPQVRAARERGTRVLAETCPQYLFLTEDALRQPVEVAQDFLCTPPVRTDADREALWGALASGDLDAVSTDHCPFTAADRRRGTDGRRVARLHADPRRAPRASRRASRSSTRACAMSASRRSGGSSSSRHRRRGCSGSASARARLEPGMDADVVVFDPAATRRLDAASLHMRTDHSPYASTTVTGWPAVTISRGTVVARDGEPADDRARPRPLPPPAAGDLRRLSPFSPARTGGDR